MIIETGSHYPFGLFDCQGRTRRRHWFFTLRHQHHDETFRSFESPTNRASSTASVRVTEDCHADGLRCALNAAQLSEEKQQLNVAELATGKQATDEG